MNHFRVFFLFLLLSAALVSSSSSRHLCGRNLFEVMQSICDEDCSQIQRNRHLKENKTYRKKRDSLVRDCCHNTCSREYLKKFCCW